MDFRTNYEANKLQAKIESATINNSISINEIVEFDELITSTNQNNKLKEQNSPKILDKFKNLESIFIDSRERIESRLDTKKRNTEMLRF